MSDKEDVSQIIAQQMRIGQYRAMVGAYDVFGVDNGLKFKFKSGAINKSNRVSITLESDDTYTVLFSKERAGVITPISKFVGIYVDQLNNLFEYETGLRISL